MTTQLKIIIAVLIAGALLLGGYLLFLNSSSSSGSGITASNITSQADQAQVQFLNLANKTGEVTFDTSILSDLRFTSRISTQTIPAPVPIGRRDPFAPIPGLPTAGN
jgi:hypothetical protein